MGLDHRGSKEQLAHLLEHLLWKGLALPSSDEYSINPYPRQPFLAHFWRPCYTVKKKRSVHNLIHHPRWVFQDPRRDGLAGGLWGDASRAGWPGAKLTVHCNCYTVDFTQSAGIETLTGPQDRVGQLGGAFPKRRGVIVEG